MTHEGPSECQRPCPDLHVMTSRVDWQAHDITHVANRQKKSGLHSRDRGMIVKTWKSCFHICASPSDLSVNLSSVQLPSPLSQLWSPKLAIPNFFGTGDRFHGRQFFHGLRVGWGRFRDDSNALHLLCTLFLLQLHQLHLRSSGIRSRRLGTPGLNHKLVDYCYSFVLYYWINIIID